MANTQQTRSIIQRKFGIMTDEWTITIQYSSGETKSYTTTRSISNILLSAKQYLLKLREDDK